MGLIQNCLLFLIVYSFTSNSQGKLVKIDLKVLPSIIVTPKIKWFYFLRYILLMLSIEVELPLAPRNYIYMCLKDYNKKINKKLYSFYVINQRALKEA